MNIRHITCQCLKVHHQTDLHLIPNSTTRQMTTIVQKIQIVSFKIYNDEKVCVMDFHFDKFNFLLIDTKVSLNNVWKLGEWYISSARASTVDWSPGNCLMSSLLRTETRFLCIKYPNCSTEIHECIDLGFYLPCTKYDGKVMFSVCLFNEGGTLWSLVPSPFQAFDPRSFLGKVPHSLLSLVLSKVLFQVLARGGGGGGASLWSQKPFLWKS